MFGNAMPFRLSLAQMQECNPVFTLEPNAEELKKPGSRKITSSAKAVALLNGTLGQFTVKYHGNLTIREGGSWRFSGMMFFVDTYDFDLHVGQSGRSTWGNFASGVGSTINGNSFFVYSVPVPVYQDEKKAYPSWGNNASPDPSDKSGNPETNLKSNIRGS
jgi:hypothetical protein